MECTVLTQIRHPQIKFIRKSIILAFALYILIGSIRISAIASAQLTTIDYQNIIQKLDIQSVEEHIKYFSNLSSRITGYPGAEAAATYIQNEFLKYGFPKSNVWSQKFNVTVPIDKGASLTLLSSAGETFKLYPMAPNLIVPVTTSQTGITGPLIYVGDGEFRDLNGKEIRDSIVLMNFNTRLNWVNLVKIGAKAVIFIEPTEAQPFEALTKRLNIPLNFPRFYIRKMDAKRILSQIHNEKVLGHIISKMVWVKATGTNIFGLIEGSENPDEIIVLSAYYDSSSIIPSIAPGASEAVDISLLLEIARVFKNYYNPRYSILFAAFSGHHQGLSGSRHFVDEYFFGDHAEIGRKIILQINLDISTASKTMGITNAGGFYNGYAYFRGSIYVPFAEHVENVVKLINRELGKNYVLINTILGGITGGAQTDILNELVKYTFRYGMYDSEPLTANLGPGYSFITLYDTLSRRESPFDTFERLNLKNLKEQAEAILCIFYTIATTERLRETYLSGFSYSSIIDRKQTPTGYRLTGTVATYNETIGWYSPIPYALIAISSSWGVTWIEMADEGGRFSIPQLYTYWEYWVNAFLINETTGNPIYVPDYGKYQFAAPHLHMEKDHDIGYLTVFKGASAVIFDFIDPSFLNIPAGWSIEVNIHETHTPPDSFGYSAQTSTDTGFSIIVLYLPAGVPLEILMRSASEGNVPLGFLINVTQEEPAGNGYAFNTGEQYIFLNTLLQFAENMHWIDRSRIALLKSYGIRTRFSNKLTSAYEKISQARRALEDNQYESLHYISLAAWSLERDIYVGLRNVIEDSTNTIVFFAAILVPFTLLFERMIFHAQGKKRIIYLVCIFTSMTATLFLVHPGFLLASNSLMTIVGLTIIILIVPILAILLGRLNAFINAAARRVKGLHFAEMDRSSVASLAFSTGIEMIRKRRRSILPLISIILMVQALVMYTSSYAIVIVKPNFISVYPPYQGIFIKRNEWAHLSQGAGENIVKVMRALYGDQAAIAPRAWVYTPRRGDQYVRFNVTHKNSSLSIYALLGMTSDEAKLSNMEGLLVKGRWFMQKDEGACILTTDQASKLGIQEVPVKISLFDINFTVVGIVDGKVLDSLLELDGERVTPLDATFTDIWNYHVKSVDTLIINFDDALRLGGMVASVSVQFNNVSLISSSAKSLFNTFSGFNLYASFQEKTMMYTRGKSIIIVGWQMQLVPSALVTLSILNIMIAAVHERKKHIEIYACVGLSPFHVAFMFLSESTIYALIGGTLGYVSSIVLGKITSIIIPGMIVAGYSSSWVVSVVILTMSITMLSSLYPALTASKMVTPSLERVWKIPTKPTGRVWKVPTPYIFSTEEVKGAIAFLAEFVRSHTGIHAETFSIKSFSFKEVRKNNIQLMKLIMNTRLAPYESGVQQNVEIIFTMDPEIKKWGMNIRLERTSGEDAAWIRLNRKFLDSIRKQMLLWRSLRPTEKDRYINRKIELEDIRVE